MTHAWPSTIFCISRISNIASRISRFVEMRCSASPTILGLKAAALANSMAAWRSAVLVMMNECKEGTKDRQRFRGALLLGAALVGISGFLGSALIYGLDHYAWN